MSDEQLVAGEDVYGVGTEAEDGKLWPAEAEVGELTGWQPVLHEELKACVGKHVTLHIGVGLAITGTLTAYDEDTTVVTVTDRDTNYVAAGAVAVLMLRGTAR